MYKMFDTGTKHLSATDDRLKVSLGSWRVKKLNLQITFIYIHFSHYANPPKCIVDTADIQKALDVFYIYFFTQWSSKLNWRNCLSSLVICEQFCCNILVQKWLLLLQGTVFDFAKWSFRPARTLTISSWPTPKNVMEGISLTHRSSIDW